MKRLARHFPRFLMLRDALPADAIPCTRASEPKSQDESVILIGATFYDFGRNKGGARAGMS